MIEAVRKSVGAVAFALTEKLRVPGGKSEPSIPLAREEVAGLSLLIALSVRCLVEELLKAASRPILSYY